MAQDNLKNKAAHGVKWSSVGAMGRSVIQFLQIAVVSSLIGPEQLGLFSMASVVVGFANVYTDAGLGKGLVQRQNPTASQITSLFWLILAMGTGIGVLIAAAAPLFSMMFQEPRLISVLQYASLTFPCLALGQTHMSLAQKEMRFRLLACTYIGASLAGFIVAIVMAYRGAGVYALITGTVVSAVAKSLIFLGEGWRRHPIGLHLIREDLRGYLRFGGFQLLSKTLNYVSSRLDRVFIGAFLGPTALGYYTLAWYLAVEPVTRVNPVINSVAVSVFARVQDHTARIRRGFLRMLGGMLTLLCPIVFGAVAISETLIQTYYGDEWGITATLAALLLITGVSKAVRHPAGSFITATGRVELRFYWYFVMAAIQLPVLYVAARYFDLQTVCLWLGILNVAYIPLMYVIVHRRVLGGFFFSLLREMFPPILLAGAMGVAVHSLGRSFPGHGLLLLVGQVLLGATVYVGLTLALRPRYVGELRRFFLGGKAAPV